MTTATLTHSVVEPSGKSKGIAGTIIVIYAVLPDPDRGRGLMHLSGTDPTISR